jgi:hypothetical protein
LQVAIGIERTIRNPTHGNKRKRNQKDDAHDLEQLPRTEPRRCLSGLLWRYERRSFRRWRRSFRRWRRSFMPWRRRWGRHGRVWLLRACLPYLFVKLATGRTCSDMKTEPRAQRWVRARSEAVLDKFLGVTAIHVLSVCQQYASVHRTQRHIAPLIFSGRDCSIAFQQVQ